MKKLLILTALLGSWRPAFADNLSLPLPYGIGSLQLPWSATEVVYGVMRPLKGGLWHQIAGASLPILTLGRLPGGERIIDGSLGVVGAWPVQSDPVDFYGGFGHDFAQDIPILKEYQSAHLNIGGSYSNALTGWSWGFTVSYAFGGSIPNPSEKEDISSKPKEPITTIVQPEEGTLKPTP